jgi:peptidoglycan/xylan/chitin deacetylase (PgdA/CDA1 family)
MVLGYHEFAPTPSADIYCMIPEIFFEQIQAVKTAHLSQYETQHACGHSSAEVIVTFDDAHVSQLRHALPVLERTRTVGHFFVPTSWVGHSMHTASWNDLRALTRSGHRVGSHSHRHALLTQCSTAVLRDELITSKKMLEDRLGELVETISMPGGRYNRRVLAECEDAGYRRIYTSRPQLDTQPICAWSAGAIVLGRLIVRRTLPLRTIADYVRGERSTVRRLQLGYGCRRVAKAVAGDVLYQTMWRALMRHMSSTQPAEQGT